jgi:hypothetical protein
MNSITLDIDNEFADDLVGRMLKQHTEMIEHNIKDFKRTKKLKPHQQEDYDYYVKLHAALKVVNEYFGSQK